MNRILLMIAALAVVGIAAGILLLVVGEQSGPIVDDTLNPNATAASRTTPKGPAGTTLNLSVIGWPPSSPHFAILGGVLLDRNGHPVGNRPIELYWWDTSSSTRPPQWNAWYANPMATTLADGSFSIRAGARNPHGTTAIYRVRFAGDPFYAGSESDSVTVESLSTR